MDARRHRGARRPGPPFLSGGAWRHIDHEQRHAQDVAIRYILEKMHRYGHDVEPDVLAGVRRFTKLFWITRAIAR